MMDHAGKSCKLRVVDAFVLYNEQHRGSGFNLTE